MQSSKNSPRITLRRLPPPHPAARSRQRRPSSRHLGRSARPRRRRIPSQPAETRADRDRNLQLLEVDQRGQLPRVEDWPGRCSATTTSTAAIGPDTLPSVVGLTTILGAGGSTSSYEEAEHTDFVFLWGSNAREAHPIWFHHLLKGIQNGARLYVVDPRRTTSAQWADVWLGTQRRHRHRARQRDGARDHPRRSARQDVHRARHDRTSRRIASCVEPYTLELRASASRAFPPTSFATRRIQYAKADRAMICWTLGITEHHNAVDNVIALINLALLTGHVGRYGCGCNPLRGQNNVQGGGDMGALPNKLPGFQDVDERRASHEVRARVGTRHHPDGRLESHGDDATRWRRRSSPRSTSSARIRRSPTPTRTTCTHLLEKLDHLVVQEIFLTKTAQLARRRASRRRRRGPRAKARSRTASVACSAVRKAVEPPGDARDEIWIMAQLAKRLGYDWGDPTAEDVWNEVRSLSPQLAGHELRASRGARRPAVAVSGRDRIRARSSSTRGSGTTIRRSAAASRRSRVVHHEGPVEHAGRRVSVHAHARAAG